MNICLFSPSAEMDKVCVLVFQEEENGSRRGYSKALSHVPTLTTALVQRQSTGSYSLTLEN